MPALVFSGLINGTFDSNLNVQYIKRKNEYVNGRLVKNVDVSFSFLACVQPLNERERDFLRRGARRIVDVRKVYTTEANTKPFDLGGYFLFDNQKWKIIKIDNRVKHSYTKFIVTRVDGNDNVK